MHMNILIVGAGPTGLVMAHELARYGVSCRLIEKTSQRSLTSRAIGIHARTLEVFELMGVVDDFLAAGHRIGAASAYSDRRRIARLPLDTLESRYPFILSLSQNETERLLEDHAGRRGVRVERGTEIMALHQDENGVSVRLRSAGGRVEEERMDWVVGCDGFHSTVRHLLDLSFKGGSYADVVLLADIRVVGEIDPLEAQLFFAPNGLTALIPMPEGRHRLVATEPPAEWGTEPTLEQCQSIMNSRGLGHLRLTDPIWTSTFKIPHRSVAHFRKGRVFLAGDAAHVHSPIGAQGMNAGIQDAFNLAWKLGLAASEAAAPSLLETYETERKPIDDAIIRWTDRGTRLLFLQGSAAHRVRTEVVSFLMQFAWLRRRIANAASQLGVRYRHGPLVEEHSVSGGPRAGDRAPDARIHGVASRTPHRFFELFARGRHTLLLLWPGGYDVPQLNLTADLLAVYKIAANGSTTADFTDVSGDVASRYGIEAAAYLVRPDGHVGFRCSLGETNNLLPDYLKKIFAKAGASDSHIRAA